MSAVSYEFLGERRDDKLAAFVAVYAGRSAEEGSALLRTAKARYGKASLHKMRVNYSLIMQ